MTAEIPLSGVERGLSGSSKNSIRFKGLTENSRSLSACAEGSTLNASNYSMISRVKPLSALSLYRGVATLNAPPPIGRRSHFLTSCGAFP